MRAIRLKAIAAATTIVISALIPTQVQADNFDALTQAAAMCKHILEEQGTSALEEYNDCFHTTYQQLIAEQDPDGGKQGPINVGFPVTECTGRLDC